MKKFLLKYIIVMTTIFVSLSANSQTFHKKYKDWSVYTTTTSGTKLCYAVSYPKKKSGNYNKRGKPHVMVTSISGKKQEVSVTSGYSYKKKTEPRLFIDGAEHKLSLTKGENAWFQSDKYDSKIIKKMKRGFQMKIKGTSSKGTYSIDAYSLKGFTNAYNKMMAMCK